MLVDKHNYSIEHFINSFSLVSNSGKRFERFAHLKYVIPKISIEGSVLEFGVWTARTTNLIAEMLPNDTVYGFDSFEGYPRIGQYIKENLTVQNLLNIKKGILLATDYLK